MKTNMLKILVLACLILSFQQTYAQSYELYYKGCNAADSLKYYGKNQEAMAEYKKAFGTVDYVHSEDYKDAYDLAIELSSFDEAQYFGKMAVINGGEASFLKTKSKTFEESGQYKQLQDSLPFYLEIYKNRINPDYIHLIDSLVYVDQYIIRGNRSYKGKFKIDKKLLPENRFDLDSSNWALLLYWIDSVGFPSEELVGTHGVDEVWVILHHNLRLAENEKYHERIFGFIETGEYAPNHMMFWYEQFQQQVKGTTFFTTWDGNTSEENLERINANRYKFYLKGLSSYSLEKNGEFMVMLW